MGSLDMSIIQNGISCCFSSQNSSQTLFWIATQLNEEDGSKYRDVAKAVFEQMNVEYTAVMRRFSGHGHFKNWDNGRTA